jgi:ADP-heptose:LPS heptosyltransferase
MNPDTMRRIDFWAGVPACFVLTLFERLRRLFGRRDPSPGERPKNVLLIQLAEMGTMVVAEPAIRRLTETHPEARLHFLCFEQIRTSVELIDRIDPRNILTIDSSSLPTVLRDTARFLWAARRLRIDTVLNLETFVRFSTLLTYLSGARRRVGFHRFNQEGVYTGDLLTHAVLYNAHIHAGHTFLDLVYALDAPDGQVPRVKRPRSQDSLTVGKRAPRPEVQSRLWERLTEISSAVGRECELVVLNPNASKRFPMRRLPLEDYARLAEKLLRDPDIAVVVTGVEEEKPDADYICSRLNSPRLVNLAGKTTLLELLELFNMARVLITNDSGPAHFACLTSVHVVVFFGPEVPDRYRPLTESLDVVYAGYTCSPCVGPFNQRLTPCNDNRCLKEIDIDRVHDLVRLRLRTRVTHGTA